jgi:aryl-alcohol dehydrogenase-like predicted oxidoreductase
MTRCAGKVRYIGASNLSAWHLMKALDPEARYFGGRLEENVARTIG